MIRFAAVIVAAGLAASPAAAGTYSADLRAPASDRFITRNIVWNCSGTACSGTTEASRPLVLCQSLASRAGALRSFAVDGRAFTPDELDRCNARAKGGNDMELADAR